MNALLILVVIAAIFVWAWRAATYYTENSPAESKCTNDCNQGRNCTCINQEKLRLDDEFNNANWPFPVQKP